MLYGLTAHGIRRSQTLHLIQPTELISWCRRRIARMYVGSLHQQHICLICQNNIAVSGGIQLEGDSEIPLPHARLDFVLQNTFIIPDAARMWTQEPNDLLGGRTPERALRDGDIGAVADAAWAISMDNPAN